VIERRRLARPSMKTSAIRHAGVAEGRGACHACGS
jgi:hypothetical protein